MEHKLYAITLYPKKKEEYTITLSNIEEFYIVDGMFYTCDTSGVVRYFSLEGIREIVSKPFCQKYKEEI